MSEHARVSVESKATQVTFFEDRAEVLRTARVELGAGISVVAIAGVSAMADDPTVIARPKGGGARALATQVVRQVREEPEAEASELAGLELEQNIARRRRGAAERSVLRTGHQADRLAGLISRWIAALGRVPRGAELAPWGESYRQLAARHHQTLDAKAAAKLELERARLDEQRVEQRLDQGRRLKPRFVTVVEAQLERAADARLEQVEVELSYRVPCALWRPEHLAKLNPRADGKGSELTIRSLATVWQQTGEEWNEVHCRFSTARPARTANAPLLSDDELRSRKKSEQEKKTVLVEARDRAIQLAGLERGTRSVEEMPGVEDGGEPLWFECARPVSIPSDGRPLRVELGELVLPAEVDRIALPERTEAVHLRATATLSGKMPLLAGPVWAGRGTELVGRTRTAFVARGEPFELGFGIDDGIRVRRRMEEKREVTPLTGTQKITRTVTLYLSNLGGAAKRLTVTERFPVSEIGEVQIGITSSAGARLDGKDGFARFEVELEPNGTRELSLAYRIEAAAKAVLPF